MFVIFAASKNCIALRKTYCTGQNDVQTIHDHSAYTNLLIEKNGKRYEVLARLYLSGACVMVELASVVFGVVGVFEGFMAFAARLMYDT